MKDDMNKGHFPQYNPSSFQTSVLTCYKENPFSFVNRSVFHHEPKSKLMSRENVSSLHAFSMTSLLRRENQLFTFLCTCLPCYFARGMIWLRKNWRIYISHMYHSTCKIAGFNHRITLKFDTCLKPSSWWINTVQFAFDLMICYNALSAKIQIFQDDEVNGMAADVALYRQAIRTHIIDCTIWSGACFSQGGISAVHVISVD